MIRRKNKNVTYIKESRLYMNFEQGAKNKRPCLIIVEKRRDDDRLDGERIQRTPCNRK